MQTDSGLQVIDADVAEGGIKYLAAGACYSDDAEFNTSMYRYHLWRTRDFTKKIALFIMLNPSTATHVKLDPTLKRCKQFAIDCDCGGFEVCNLFAFRATKPADMRAARNPIGEKNDDIIGLRAKMTASRDGFVIAAWSQHGTYGGRGEEVRGMLRHRLGLKLHYLRMGAKNMPHHPLYLPADLRPQAWSLTYQPFGRIIRSRITSTNTSGTHSGHLPHAATIVQMNAASTRRTITVRGIVIVGLQSSQSRAPRAAVLCAGAH